MTHFCSVEHSKTDTFFTSLSIHPHCLCHSMLKGKNARPKSPLTNGHFSFTHLLFTVYFDPFFSPHWHWIHSSLFCCSCVCFNGVCSQVIHIEKKILFIHIVHPSNSRLFFSYFRPLCIVRPKQKKKKKIRKESTHRAT